MGRAAAAFAFAGSVLVACGCGGGRPQVDDRRVVVQVSEYAITIGQFDQLAQILAAEISLPSDMDSLRQAVLDVIVARELLLLEGEARGLAEEPEIAVQVAQRERELVVAAMSQREVDGYVEFSEEEVQLTERLIERSTFGGFDISGYKNTYTEKLTELIEAKVKGEEIVAVPPAEEPKVLALMEALKRSVKEAEARDAAGRTIAKAKRKMAPSTRKTRAPKWRKSTG